MNDSQHPPNDVLFDLIEGRLDDAQSARIDAHLKQCAECSQQVEASIAGAATDVVESMSEAASERMHLTLAHAWDERAAARATQVGAANMAGITTERIEIPDARRPARRLFGDRPRRRPDRQRGRWLVPAVAFGLLAILAGTSALLVDNHPGGDGVGRSSTPNTSERAELGGDADANFVPPEAAAVGNAGDNEIASDGAAERADGSGPPTAAPTAAASNGQVAKAAAEATEGDVLGIQPAAKPDRICAASTDTIRIVLPDGRIPQRIINGPFGVIIVCG